MISKITILNIDQIDLFSVKQQHRKLEKIFISTGIAKLIAHVINVFEVLAECFYQHSFKGAQFIWDDKEIIQFLKDEVEALDTVLHVNTVLDQRACRKIKNLAKAVTMTVKSCLKKEAQYAGLTELDNKLNKVIWGMGSLKSKTQATESTVQTNLQTLSISSSSSLEPVNKAEADRGIKGSSKEGVILKPIASPEDIEYVSSIIRKQPHFCLYTERYLERHGEALAQALLLTKKMNEKGIPLLYTAQRKDAVIFQVLMKKIHESMYGDLGKHKKVVRTDRFATLSTIQEAQFSDFDSSYKSLICASLNIFDCQHGESVNFYLNQGKSSSLEFNLEKLIWEELATYGFKEESKLYFVSKVLKIYKDFESLLPQGILKVIILDVEDLSKYVRLCSDFGKSTNLAISQANSEELREYLLKVNMKTDDIDDIQARVLAPRPNLKVLKVVRCLGEKDKKIFKQAKEQLSAAVRELLYPASR